MKRSLIQGLAVALMAATAIGCAEEAPAPGYGTIQLAMDVPACAATGTALGGQGVCSFKAFILNGAWTSPGSRPDSLFDSGCVAYGGDLITVGPIESVSNATVYLEFFSDTDCNTATRYGVRGGVRIPEGDEPAGNWFVPTFPVDGFGMFPVLDQSRYDTAAATACSTDADCTAQNDDGSYVISPLARCVTGACELPRSLYPINTDGPRAFHTATALEDGRILLVGGLGREAGGQYFATDETFEYFDPVTMTFGKLEDVEGASGQRLAFHSMVSLGGSKVAIVGGVEKATFAFTDASAVGAGKRVLSLDFPEAGTNLSSLVYTVDVAANRADTGSLPSPVALAQVSRVSGGNLLVSGGVVPLESGNGLVPTNRADECTVSGAPSCASVAGMSIDRSTHCSFCTSGSEAACDELLLFGGIHATDPATAGDKLGDRYTAAEQTFTPIKRLESMLTGNVVFPGCLRTGGTNYLVGGTGRRNLPPSIPPYVLAEENGGIGAVEVQGLDKLDTPFRVHTAQVALPDGSVLVTGGLSDTGRALSSAYIVSGTNIEAAVNMNQARFGHTATVITSGPLAGAVLVAGGFTTDAAGNLSFASGAEIYVPASR